MGVTCSGLGSCGGSGLGNRSIGRGGDGSDNSSIARRD
jgi:hypothetical protein